MTRQRKKLYTEGTWTNEYQLVEITYYDNGTTMQVTWNFTPNGKTTKEVLQSYVDQVIWEINHPNLTDD